MEDAWIVKEWKEKKFKYDTGLIQKDALDRGGGEVGEYTAYALRIVTYGIFVSLGLIILNSINASSFVICQMKTQLTTRKAAWAEWVWMHIVHLSVYLSICNH